MTRTIRVDDQVYAWLQRQARAFQDTPNSVLRRVAGFDSPQGKCIAESRRLREIDPPSLAQRSVGQMERAISHRKAGETERSRVVEQIEKLHRVNLRRIKFRWRKVYIDEIGQIYWIFVGFNNFHGISEAVIHDTQTSRTARTDGKFVFGACTGNAIKVYEGPLPELLSHIGNFRTDGEADRKFDIEWTNGWPMVKQAPNFRLEFLGEI